MNDGKNAGPQPERRPKPVWQKSGQSKRPGTNEIPVAYLTCARWLLDNPQVLEVWGMVSDLPEISTPEASVTLDAGTWFLCRVALPPRDGAANADRLTDSIISFVPKV